MELSVFDPGGAVTVRAAGRLDSGNYPALQQTVDDLQLGGKDLIFDLTGLEYISSSGLRVLLSAQKKAGAGKMKIIGVRDEVYDIFTMTGFDRILDVERLRKAEDPAKTSFKDILAGFVRTQPDRAFLKYRGEVFTWRVIDVCSDVVASDLRKAGVKRGTHVGLCASNSANWVFTFFAIQKLGAVACLLNFNYTADELKTACAIGDITHLCCDREKTADPDIASELIDIGPGADFRKRAAEEGAPVKTDYPAVSPDDVCVMIYTSGSTGKPKGVLLSAYNLLYSSALRAAVIGITPADKVCLILPLFHTFGLSAGFFCNALCGGSVVIPDEIRTGAILDTIEKERCTLFHSVPTMVLAVMGSKDFSPERVKTLRCINLGGSAVSRAQVLKMRDAFPNVHFLVNYGLSEASLSTITEYGDTVDHICDTVGKPVDDVEIRIADPETQRECPTGTAGEILIRGFNLTCSYYKLPPEQQPIDEKGWLHTGDRGFLDADGYLHFDGRYKELIIRGGENIMPNEIASVISARDDVQDVKVVGVPDEFYGEAVCACVVMKDGCEPDEAEMRTYLAGKLAKQKIPAYFMYPEAIPRLANGKPDMVSLKKAAADRFAKKP